MHVPRLCEECTSPTKDNNKLLVIISIISLLTQNFPSPFDPRIQRHYSVRSKYKVNCLRNGCDDNQIVPVHTAHQPPDG
jgi:hypothetical protein